MVAVLSGHYRNFEGFFAAPLPCRVLNWLLLITSRVESLKPLTIYPRVSSIFLTHQYTPIPETDVCSRSLQYSQDSAAKAQRTWFVGYSIVLRTITTIPYSRLKLRLNCV